MSLRWILLSGNSSLNKTRKLTLVAVLLATAIALHVIERSIPIPTNIPGLKLGLANIVTVVTIFLLRKPQIFSFVIIRVTITTLFFSGLTAFWFSLTGALFSLSIMMIIAYKFPGKFSISSMSIIGALAHNIGQLTIAAIIIRTWSLFYYFPVIMLSAIVAGFFVGVSSSRLLKFLYNRKFLIRNKEYEILALKE